MEEELYEAFETGHFENALFAIRKNPELIDYRLPNTRADTLLLASCLHGRPDITFELLDVDAEPFFNCHSMHGRNVFNVVYTPEQFAALEVILKHTAHWQEPESVKAWEVAFEGSLEEAFYTGEFTRSLRLLRYRPSLINHVTVTGLSLISIAQRYERKELVSLLLSMGSNPWAGTSNPFDYSATKVQQDILADILRVTKADQAGDMWDDWSDDFIIEE